MGFFKGTAKVIGVGVLIAAIVGGYMLPGFLVYIIEWAAKDKAFVVCFAGAYPIPIYVDYPDTYSYGGLIKSNLLPEVVTKGSSLLIGENNQNIITTITNATCVGRYKVD